MIDETPQKDDSNSASPSIQIKSVELGDIIQIHAPKNREIHDQIYYVFYADEHRLKLLNTSNRQLLSLAIESYIADESITGIALLSRSKDKGFARQNRLLPLAWVDVHFGGDMPAVISGEISNLEEDMIEITTYPDIRVIYIDFGYQGIPEDLPIEKIVIRDRPAAVKRRLRPSDSTADEMSREEAEEMATIEYDNQGEFVIHIPENAMPNPSVESALDDMIDRDIAVEEDDDLGEILVNVEVPESERRYSVEAQVADLMGELLSKGKDVILDDAHRLVTRFKQLRHQFSVFDANENVVQSKVTSFLNKPIVERIARQDASIPWIIPIIQQKRIMYMDNVTSSVINEAFVGPNIEPVSIIDDLAALNEPEPDYLSNLRKMAQSMKGVVEDRMMTESYLDVLVQTPVECIVDTEGGFKSKVLNFGDKGLNSESKAFVTRRLLPEDTTLAKHIKGRNANVFIREPIHNTGDIAHVKSVMFLPMSALIHSLVQLPSTSIYVKSKLATISLYKHRMLRELTEVQSREISDFAKELHYKTAESESGEPFLHTFTHYYTEVEKDDDTLHSMLNSIIPRTRTLIRIMKTALTPYYSFAQIVNALEPFFVEQENITFQHYLEIRYYVKEKIKTYISDFDKRRKEFGALKKSLTSRVPINRVGAVFQPDFAQFFKNAYKITIDTTASELLNWILSADAAELYLNMIRLEGLSYLNLPENLLESVAPETSDPEKVRERDCSTRVIAKKYRSLVELQKDNGEEVVFCDKAHDDTPYALVSKYKDERKRFNAEEFREFFVEKLIGAHECPSHLAEELADTILLGKKRVKEGEYAVLEISPKLGQGLRLDDLSPAEKREAEQEADNRKKTEYYRRVKDEWVRDTEVNADSFMDTNALFCNISSQCSKIPDSSQCVPNTTAAMQMRLSQRARMVEEFDARVTKSIDELRKEVETRVNEQRVKIRRNKVLKDDALYKPNDYAYQLGKFVSSTESIVESPNAPLLELILSLPDFVDKQARILHFGEQFTRPPMETELQEDPHWMYCVQTNVKLLPISLYLLAKSFVVFASNESYTDVLNALCRTNGTLSDDGDSIVDKYTGYVLRKIDYSEEEGFDDGGFKITSNAIVEKDLATMVQETLAKKHPIFEDPIAQMIYNVFRAIADNIGVSNMNDIEEFVLRISNEMMYDASIVSSETDYVAAQKDKDKAKKMPYTTYQNQTLITLVACSTLVAIQTVIPSFKPKKTFPGCVQSFDGFPMDGNPENAGGVQYMACVLHGIKKSSAQPWKSIEPLNAATLAKRMKPIIREYVVARPDVKKMYELKRAYLILQPDDTNIPNAVSVNRWTHFLPALYPPNLAKPPLGITSEYEKEMFHSMTKGTKDQLTYIQAIKAKLLLHAYGMEELIEHIVSKKRAVLATSAGQPFLENACCSEGAVSPFRYFANENENIELYARRAAKMGQVLDRVTYLSKAKIFFDPDSSRLTYTRLPDNIVEQVIYAAYMYYGHFDDDMPIPPHFHTVIKDKPAYDRYGSMNEKIAYLKKHGKNYALDDYYALMRVVNVRNIIHVIPGKEVSCINGFKDMLEYFDLKDSSIVEKRLRDLIWATLDEYNPKVMVYEERDSVRALNQYLLRANKKMGEIVYDFVRKTSSLSDATAKRTKDAIENIDKWNVDSNVACRQISNSVYLLSKVFPSQIMNNHIYTKVPKHWNFAEIHTRKIQREFIDKYYGELAPFLIETANQNVVNTFATYLSRVKSRIYDLSMFVEQIPRFSPIRKGEYTYYSLYPENTIMLLYKYCWYSVLHEYVVVSTDAEFKRMREEEWKMKTRETMKDQVDEIVGQEDDDTELRQIRIVESEDMELRKQASDLLVAMLKMESSVKSTIDKSYETVMGDTMKLKYKDKNRITEYLAGLNKDDRKLEQLLRSHKLGRWNVGLQKGLYQYDKNTYEKEVSDDLIYMVPQDTSQELEVEDLDRIDEIDNEVYEQEGYNIDRLDEEYENGHYYEEDYAEDRETDF